MARTRDMDDDSITCSFCGRSAKYVGQLISSPTGATICRNCVDICRGLYNEEKQHTPQESEIPVLEVPKPVKIKEELDKYVIGQEEAKKVLEASDA